jgi:hypothetical protein
MYNFIKSSQQFLRFVQVNFNYPIPKTVKPHYMLTPLISVHPISTDLSATTQIQTGGQLPFKSKQLRVFKFITI